LSGVIVDLEPRGRISRSRPSEGTLQVTPRACISKSGSESV